MAYLFSSPKEFVTLKNEVKRKDDFEASVVFSLHCVCIPLLDEDIVAKIQSLESFYDAQIRFTEKQFPILKLYQTILTLGQDLLTTFSVRELTLPAIGNQASDVLSRITTAAPVWLCTDLSRPGCEPFELTVSDTAELEKHFQYGGMLVSLSGEEYIVDFKQMKLKSSSGKGGSLQRVPSLDGVPQQKVRVEIKGMLSKVEGARDALEKLLDEGHTKAEPIQFSYLPSSDSRQQIRNIVRQFCVKFDMTFEKRDLKFKLHITGAPGYVKGVRKQVKHQLVASSILKCESSLPLSPALSSQVVSSSVMGPSSNLGLNAIAAPAGKLLAMPVAEISTCLSPHPLLTKRLSPAPSHRQDFSLASTTRECLTSATSAALPFNLTLSRSPVQALNPASPLTLGNLSHTNFNPVVAISPKLDSNPIPISRPTSTPSPERSPTLRPGFLEAGTVPRLWEPQTEKCIFCNVASNSEEWKAVLKLARDTLPSISMKKVERVQNMNLWEKYSLEGKHMTDRNNGGTNERYLFHGTTKVDPHDVARADSGVDFRYSMSNRKSLMWGTGAYFAAKLSYSDHYSYKLPDGTRQVMVVSVLTGYSYSFGSTISRELTKPPVYILSHESRLYDTVNGETGNSVVYVVYDHCKTCPAYIITYTKST